MCMRKFKAPDKCLSGGTQSESRRGQSPLHEQQGDGKTPLGN